MERKLVFALLFMEKEAYMHTVKLSNGIEVPVLGFGTWQLKGVKCTEMVEYALKSGYSCLLYTSKRCCDRSHGSRFHDGKHGRSCW